MEKYLDKIWLFYYNDEGQHHLYAITNDKKLAKQFMEERDMKKFTVKKTQDDHETWKEIANEASDAVLDQRYLQTRKVTKNNTYSTIQVPILCTMYESQCVDADFAELPFTDEAFWYKMPSMKVFNDKLIKALTVLEFHKYEQFFDTSGYSFEDDIDYASPDTELDEVGLLISTFYHLFNK